MTRDKRIQKAKLLLKGAEEAIAPFQKKLQTAQDELNSAERSFDEGERVSVTETCRRGCCVENEYVGVIVGPTPNGLWNVKDDESGHIYQYVYEGDIKRL